MLSSCHGWKKYTKFSIHISNGEVEVENNSTSKSVQGPMFEKRTIGDRD